MMYTWLYVIVDSNNDNDNNNNNNKKMEILGYTIDFNKMLKVIIKYGST